MDQNSQGFDEKLKQEVEKVLVEKIISALESKQIDFSQMRASANYILDNIHTIKDYSQFILFLENLKNQWLIFSDIYNLYKNKFYKNKEELMIEKLSQYISSNTKN